MNITLLDWDSRFFKMPVVKIVISKNENITTAETLAYCIQQQYKMLYFFVDCNNYNALEELCKQTGPSISTKLVFSMKCIKQNNKGEGFEGFTLIHKNEIEQNLKKGLLKLAIKAGTFSRFKLDKKIESGLFEEMYSHWINKIINDSDTQIIAIANALPDKKEIIGFLAYKKMTDDFKVEFIAIEKKWQGRGLGNALLKKMMHEANEKNIKQIFVETQMENKVACAFYTACGFNITETIKIFHVHL
jgi:dTDP-4-amino-4,6-dideoxy-D-galactose acyltransferase